MRAGGSQRSTCRFIRLQGKWLPWLRRLSTRHQVPAAAMRKAPIAEPFMGTPKYRTL
jgi:hypothetical protein